MNRVGGRRECPKQPLSIRGCRPSRSSNARVPDLHSPLYLRKQAGAVAAAFGAGLVKGCPLQRLATYHFPISQAITASQPCCLAGELKHMFNSIPSGFRVSGGSHSALSKLASVSWVNVQRQAAA